MSEFGAWIDSVTEDDLLGDAGQVGFSGHVKHPTVLKLGIWGQRMGKRLADRPTEEWMNPQAVSSQENIEDQQSWLSGLMADCYGAAYEIQPELRAEEYVSEEAAQRRDFIGSMLQNKDFISARSQSVCNHGISTLLAENLASQVVQFVQQEKEHQEQEGQDGRQSGHDQEDDSYGTAIRKSLAVSKAAKSLKQDAQNATDAQDMLGCGDESGNAGQLDLQAMRERYQQIQKSPMLRAVLEMAGKLRLVSKGLQQRKLIQGPNEFTGVVLGNRIDRLVSSEAIRFAAGGEIELEFLTRLADKQVLNYKREDRKPSGRGPIVVWVDESGSMDSGNRIVTAKGLALALAWLAKRQKRAVFLAGFCADYHWGNINSCQILPGEKKEAELIKWVESFEQGGTCGVPFVNSMSIDLFKEKATGRADLIVITDGEMNVGDQEQQRFLEWKKKNNVHSFGIFIQESGDGLRGLFDRSWSVNEIGISCDAVSTVLSI